MKNVLCHTDGDVRVMSGMCAEPRIYNATKHCEKHLITLYCCHTPTPYEWPQDWGRTCNMTASHQLLLCCNSYGRSRLNPGKLSYEPHMLNVWKYPDAYLVNLTHFCGPEFSVGNIWFSTSFRVFFFWQIYVCIWGFLISKFLNLQYQKTS